MGADFERLAAAFGVRLSPRARDDVRRLAACIECVDRVIDATDDAAERSRLSASIVRALRGGRERDVDLDSALDLDLDLDPRRTELRARIAELRAIVTRRGVSAAFAGLAAEVLSNTEAARACASHDEYVERVVREGRLTARMAMLVAGEDCEGEFGRFLLAVAEPANLVDKLVDARGDAARGEIALAPDLRLHARLVVEVLRRLPALLRMHPRPGWLLAWGASSTLGLARPDPRETHECAPRSASCTAGTSCDLPESTR
jgi:hypothetical protein